LMGVLGMGLGGALCGALFAATAARYCRALAGPGMAGNRPALRWSMSLVAWSLGVAALVSGALNVIVFRGPSRFLWPLAQCVGPLALLSLVACGIAAMYDCMVGHKVSRLFMWSAIGCALSLAASWLVLDELGGA
jgi:hypothetical protein